MDSARLSLTRDQILAYRRRVGALDVRLPLTDDSLRRAAWAGLQDSMPRAALLSIHARVEHATPDIWGHPSLIQLWGPRYSAYVVPALDRAIFTLGRYPDDERGRQRAERAAADLRQALGDRRTGHHDVGRALGVNPNSLKYGAVTGEIVIRWAGALQPTIWMLPRPEIDPVDARRELARRYLHVFGPTTAQSFADWAGISAKAANATFHNLAPELTPAATPIGDGWILSADEADMRAPAAKPAAARFLPSGDTYFLLWAKDRELLVPDAVERTELWTSRVWPGALLIGGEIAGVWRRANEIVAIDTWRALTGGERAAAEEEAATMPLPGLRRPIEVRWSA